MHANDDVGWAHVIESVTKESQFFRIDLKGPKVTTD